jgi:hypothetical protein
MRNLFLCLMLSGLGFAVYSQEIGYIKNDSAYISCDIYKQNEIKSAKTCIVRAKNPSRDVTYTPTQLRAYGYGKTDYYSHKVVLGSDTIQRFLEAIVQGDSPVFYMADASGSHFYIQKDKNQLVELVKENDKYKVQLSEYYDAPVGIIPRLHFGFSRTGIIQTVKFIKGSSLEIVSDASGTAIPEQKVLTIKQKKRMRMKRPVLSLTLQSGITTQQLPLDLQLSLPGTWDEFKGSSITYSMSADIPLMKYWPLTYHQEICFNKFVNDYRKGSNPPDYQLIQDFSVLSFPAMVRYTFGLKKFTTFINAGLQLDISLNKNNVGWLQTTASQNEVGSSSGYMDYKTLQMGYTAGFGVKYALNKKFGLCSEFRYSGIINALSEKAGPEKQNIFKIGITYNIFKVGI